VLELRHVQVLAETIALDRTLFDVMNNRHRLIVNIMCIELFGLRFLGFGVDFFLIVVDTLVLLLGGHGVCSMF